MDPGLVAPLRRLLAAAVLLGGAAPGAEWKQFRTQKFELVSAAEDDEAGAAVAMFEAARRRCEESTGWRTRGAPVAVFLAGHLTTGYFFAHGRDQLRIRTPLRDELPAAAREYARLWLRRSGRNLPPWMFEGLARRCSGVAAEAVTDPLPLNLLLASDARHVPLAEAARLVSYLAAQAGPRFPSLLDALARSPQAEQVLEFFLAKPLARIEIEARSHIAANARADSGVPPWTASIADEAARALIEAQLDGRPEWSSLARRFPRDGRVQAATGLALAALGRSEAARAALERAVALGTTDAEALWQYAGQLRDPAPILMKLLQLDPNHWDTRIKLAQNFIAAKVYDRAMKVLEPLPESSAPEASAYYRLQSQAARAAGNRSEARAAAGRLAEIARSEEDRRVALELRKQAEEMPEPRPGEEPGRGVTVSDEKNRGARVRGARRMPETYGPAETGTPPADPPFREGLLLRVECRDEQATLHIRSGGEVHQFRILDARQVVVRSREGSTVDLPCGNLTPPRRVDYHVETGPEPMLRWLEFR